MNQDQTPYLQARYGTSKPAIARWVTPALVLLLVGGTWLIWSANHFSKPEVHANFISFSTDSPTQMSMTYFVHVRSANKSHECTITASDYQANIVGQITDQIPPGANNFRRTVHIPTRAPAVSASIERCR
jgi:hypothetical protein